MEIINSTSTMKEKAIHLTQPLEDSCSLDVVDQIYLEDFVSGNPFTTEPRVNLETLRLSVSFEVPEDGQSTEEFYRQAVQQLKVVAPNLQSICFEGGYVYRSDEETASAVHDELRRLRSHFDMLSSIFISSKLPMLRIKFSAIFTFHEKTINSANVPKMLKNVFDFYDDIDDRFLKRGILDFIYIADGGLPFTVRLLVNVPILRDFVPFQRNRFCDSSSASLSRFFKL